MRSPGNIKLPIRYVEKIGRSDIDALDFLFDMTIPELPKLLTEQHRFNLPGLMVVRSTTYPITALVFFKPPKGVRLFKGQKYLVFAAHDLDRLIKYFQKWSEKNQHVYLHPVLSHVCTVLKVKCTGPQTTKFITEPKC
jgi:hypothetical protein